jgi:hypothetical protein
VPSSSPSESPSSQVSDETSSGFPNSRALNLNGEYVSMLKKITVSHFYCACVFSRLPHRVMYRH